LCVCVCVCVCVVVVCVCLQCVCACGPDALRLRVLRRRRVRLPHRRRRRWVSVGPAVSGSSQPWEGGVTHVCVCVCVCVCVVPRSLSLSVSVSVPLLPSLTQAHATPYLPPSQLPQSLSGSLSFCSPPSLFCITEEIAVVTCWSVICCHL
jgi:hypothetical protein